MTFESILLLVYLGIVIIVGVVLAHSLRKAEKEMVLEFIEKFPGKCMICSNHRYGVSHGHIPPGEGVKRHYCIERKGYHGV